MTAALGNRFADPAPVMPRRVVVVDGPPECSLQLPDRPADDPSPSSGSLLKRCASARKNGSRSAGRSGSQAAMIMAS